MVNGRRSGVKPDKEMQRTYAPGGSVGSVKRPRVSETVRGSWEPEAGQAVMVTPGSDSSAEKRTRPLRRDAKMGPRREHLAPQPIDPKGVGGSGPIGRYGPARKGADTTAVMATPRARREERRDMCEASLTVGVSGERSESTARRVRRPRCYVSPSFAAPGMSSSRRRAAGGRRIHDRRFRVRRSDEPPRGPPGRERLATELPRRDCR